MTRKLYGLSIFILCMSFAGVAFALTPIEELGKKLYFDENLSEPKGQSCASCHDPGSGFVDPDNLIPVSAGASGSLHGGRNSPSSAYAAFSPAFRFDEVAGLYVGGQFWDGREPSLAGQAAGPFRNPVEMAMPDKKAVVKRLKQDWQYYKLFSKAFSTEDGPFNLLFVPTWSNQAVSETYDLMAKAIGEFEKTQLFNKFNSKYDYYLVGKEQLTNRELRGLALFNNKGKCALCHITEVGIAPDGGIMPPLLTDFTYDNLGVPKNLEIDKLIGEPQPTDFGLGAVVPYPSENGKFKVMSLRNIELTAPYTHNGIFKTLEEVVHFYNTRDALGVCADQYDPEFGKSCWPAAEVPETVNTAELGNLGLTPAQEAKIVTFMKTLTDRDPVEFPPVFAQENFPPSP